MPTPGTLIDKIWDSHVIHAEDDGTCLLYVDRHLIQDESSPVAFERLRAANRRVRRPELAFAVADHNAPTLRDRHGGRSLDLVDAASRAQIEALAHNAAEFGIAAYGLDDLRHGILHIVAPEQGFILPGTLVVGGDSHTATHGALGALAFGIGTAEIEAVLATQALLQRRPRTLRVTIDGALGPGVFAKDIVLALIGRMGTGGATGHFIEFAGPAVAALSMEGRMTLCNMAVEAGARAGLIAPDETTFAYLKGRPHAPTGVAWEAALAQWRTLRADPGAVYDREVTLDSSGLAPQVTWGTSPQDVLPITGVVPDPADAPDEDRRAAMTRALAYMGLTPGTKLQDIRIDKVFIGSCTNGRIEDLRAAAAIASGRKVAARVQALVVPGSGLVNRQAEEEGLDRIFRDAGFEWREPGCSMCLAMNGDRLRPGERCAATSSRNFEGRQGRDGRTHLMSPAMAAGAAVAGRITDVREFAT